MIDGLECLYKNVKLYCSYLMQARNHYELLTGMYFSVTYALTKIR